MDFFFFFVIWEINLARFLLKLSFWKFKEFCSLPIWTFAFNYCIIFFFLVTNLHVKQTRIPLLCTLIALQPATSYSPFQSAQKFPVADNSWIKWFQTKIFRNCYLFTVNVFYLSFPLKLRIAFILCFIKFKCNTQNTFCLSSFYSVYGCAFSH